MSKNKVFIKLSNLSDTQVIASVIVFLMFIMPIIINVVITSPFILTFINPSNAGVWISYYAALSGGLLTMLGVASTIMYQKKQVAIQEEKDQIRGTFELTQKYRPILIIGAHQVNIYEKDNHIRLILTLRNLGRGEANYTNLDIDLPNHIRLLSDSYFSVFCANEAIRVIFEFDILHYEDTNPCSHGSFDIAVTFQDLFETEYKFTSHATVNLKILKQHRLIDDEIQLIEDGISESEIIITPPKYDFIDIDESTLI